MVEDAQAGINDNDTVITANAELLDELYTLVGAVTNASGAFDNSIGCACRTSG